MKTAEEIQAKIAEVKLYEDECYMMVDCIAQKIHPKSINHKWKSFHDLNAAIKYPMDHWMERGRVYMEIGNALKWVLK